MLECIVVLSLYPEMQKHLIIKIGFCFGNFNELNQKTPTFMYCFFKLSGYAFLQNEKCLYFVVQMYIPFDLLIPKRAIMTIFGD